MASGTKDWPKSVSSFQKNLKEPARLRHLCEEETQGIERTADQPANRNEVRSLAFNLINSVFH